MPKRHMVNGQPTDHKQELYPRHRINHHADDHLPASAPSMHDTSRRYQGLDNTNLSPPADHPTDHKRSTAASISDQKVKR